MPPVTPPVVAPIQVGSMSTALGVVLTGPSANTLYTLSSDPSNGSTCTGACLIAWPPLLVPSGGAVSGPAGTSLTFPLIKGDTLVSNFNDMANRQRTGTTIVQLSPSGSRHLFAFITPASVAGRCPGGVGLTTALVVLRSGWVIVGACRPRTARRPPRRPGAWSS